MFALLALPALAANPLGPVNVDGTVPADDVAVVVGVEHYRHLPRKVGSPPIASS